MRSKQGVVIAREPVFLDEGNPASRWLEATKYVDDRLQK